GGAWERTVSGRRTAGRRIRQGHRIRGCGGPCVAWPAARAHGAPQSRVRRASSSTTLSNQPRSRFHRPSAGGTRRNSRSIADRACVRTGGPASGTDGRTLLLEAAGAAAVVFTAPLPLAPPWLGGSFGRLPSRGLGPTGGGGWGAVFALSSAP